MNDRESSLGLFGAFERHNFGDWLMAYCAEELLKPKECEWLYDFKDFGMGVNPLVGNFAKLNSFLTRTEEPSVFHIGGETLACSMEAAAEMSSQSSNGDFERLLHYVLPEKNRSKPIRRFFFGVGGTGIPSLDLSHTKYLVDSLYSALWVSVRDPLTQLNLAKLGVKASLTPDLVHVISKILPFDRHSTTNKTKLVLQISDVILSNHFNETVEMLLENFSDFDSITLVIAGIAPGHDSFMAYLNLVRVVSRIRPNWISISFDIDPLNIVREIATADLVVASSLHFRIVAMSYGIPRISIFVEKSINYGKYWDLTDFSVQNYSDMGKVFSEIKRVESDQFNELALLRTKEVIGNWSEMMEAYER